MSYLIVCGSRILVRLAEAKRKILCEKGTYCIFIGYVEHFKSYKFYVIESNDSLFMKTFIQSRYDLYDEERFTLTPRPKDMIQKSSNKNLTQVEDVSGGTDFVDGLSKPRRRTRDRKAKSFRFDFQLYLVKGTRYKTVSHYQYCFIKILNPCHFKCFKIYLILCISN